MQLLAGNEGAKVLAGGHSLIPMMKLRLAMPTALVDIGHIEALKGITINGDGGLSIGALTTFAEIASSELVRAHAPAAGGGCWGGGRPGGTKPRHDWGERIPRRPGVRPANGPDGAGGDL